MKDMIKRIREEREGFTLAELLIVVAIIAVLVAIAVPVFSSQLEKSREAVDAANIRAAYAELMSEAITDESATNKTVDLKQTEAGWQNEFDFPANLTGGTTEPAKDGTATISYNATTKQASIDIKLTK